MMKRIAINLMVQLPIAGLTVVHGVAHAVTLRPQATTGFVSVYVLLIPQWLLATWLSSRERPSQHRWLLLALVFGPTFCLCGLRPSSCHSLPSVSCTASATDTI